MPKIAVEVDVHGMSVDDLEVGKEVEKLFASIFSSSDVIICDEDMRDDCGFFVLFRAFNYGSGFGGELHNVTINIENNATEKEFEFQTSGKGRLTKSILSIASSELFGLAADSLRFLIT